MKLLAVLAALAIAVTTMPANAQNERMPVKNALIVVTDDPAMYPILEAGGPPSSIRRALETVTALLSSPAHHAPTTEDGSFELDMSLNSGIYNVTAFAPGFVTSSLDVSIAPGSTANVTVFMQPSAVVSGRVVDEQGNPIPGIVVAAGSRHSANYDVTMSDGVFVLDTGLKTGSHEIYAFKPGIDAGKLNSTELGILASNSIPLFKNDGGYVSSVSTVQLEQGKLTTLNIRMESSHIIQGRITDETGSALPGIAVFAFDRNGNMANTMAITNATGHYILDNDLAAGTYMVVVPSLFSKGYAPASVDVKVPADSIDLMLNESSSISGRVVDAAGKPVQGATIFAVLKGADQGELAQFLSAGMASARTDSQGRFMLQDGLSEGAYIVTASFGNIPVTHSVEIQSGDIVEIIKLDFSEAITIEGRVTSAGKPVSNASVLPSAFPGADLFAAKSDKDGNFILTIPVKDARDKPLFSEIMISAAGYRTVTANASDASVTAVLESLPLAKITGTVIAQKSLSPSIETVLTRKGTLVFDYAGAQYGVGVQTNSRIVDASFDQPSKRVNIRLEGVQSSAGRSEFVISKELLGGPFAISLDGRPAENIEVVENQTHATIAIDHEHGIQEITIQGTNVVPEFPVPTAAMSAIGLAALLLYRRLRR